MSMHYEASVFFGVAFKRTSATGKRLDLYVEKAGGTPAKTETRGVEICEVGSRPTGEIWMVVRAKGSGQTFSREDEIKAPGMLVEASTWRPALAAFLIDVLKIESPPPVGWHFAGSVS